MLGNYRFKNNKAESNTLAMPPFAKSIWFCF